MLETILFSSFSSLLLGSAIMVIIASEAIHSALWLVLSFISAASLWILLNTEFLGLMLILVYVGAILTLFLFVIMTLSTTPPQQLPPFQVSSRYGISLSIVLAGLVCLLYSLYQADAYLSITQSTNQLLIEQAGNTKALGLELYTHYAYPFELTGFLLLTAIIISISVHSQFQPDRKLGHSKLLTKKEQLSVRRKDRIQLVSGN